MFSRLLTTRRFAPLFWCQFFSAFNDNFVRYILAMLILFRLGERSSGSLITLALAIFILPSIFLSGLGGELADSRDKALLARRLKFGEIFVQAIAALGFYTLSLPLLYLALFGLGVIAALFGPIKYGILPDHLETRELPAGNALVEGATFLAILLGLAAGGFAAEGGRSPVSVVLQLMLVAFACWGASRLIPATGVAAPRLRVNRNLLKSTMDLITGLVKQRPLLVGALGLSWFWLTGAVVISLVQFVVKKRIGGGIDVETAVNAIFAVGIGAGSLLAAVLSHGRIILLLVPPAAVAMAIALVDIGLSTAGSTAAPSNLDVAQFFASSSGIRMAIDVAALAAAGGLFVVPLFAAVQSWAHEDRRARVVAGVNVLNSVFIVAGTLVTAGLQSPMVGLSESTILIGLGMLNGLAGLWLFRSLPGNFAGDTLNIFFRLANRLEVNGLENVHRAGPRCVIAVNHVSFLDAPLILSLIDEKPIFAIDWQIARAWWVRPFRRIARIFPMDPLKPLATRALVEAVKRGDRLVIFPEGRLTVTGAIMKIYDGAGLIADKAEAMVVPVRIEGLEQSFFSRLSGAQVRRRLFPKVRVTFAEPRLLTLDNALTGRERRRAAGLALYDRMSDLIFATTDYNQTLIAALALAIRRKPSGNVIVQDPVSGELSGRKVLMGAAVLARKIMAFTDAGEPVGVLLPNANGTAVVFFAIQAAGRVAAMLNYTAGPANLAAACKAANVRTILCSRSFVAKANLGPVIDALAQHVTIRWLDDIRSQIGFANKLRSFLDAGRPLVGRDPSAPAVILFTSGSEGLPKGVALSHRNLLANIAQIMARFDITPADIVFNALPVFHSFGLTGGLLLPMLTGMRLYLYPSPLHYRQIPELIYGTNATVLFGTDTFLMGYGRTANPYDFRSLRYIVSGAEPVKAETRRLFMDKFGQRILEGYGVTEAAPVLAVNTAQFNRVGSVGRLMPGIEYRLEEVAGIAEAGRLHVRGPNIMIGYYRADNPAVLEPTPGGWHDTGDIVTVDREHFVTIKGRAKRFAKIGGEMLSLAAIEQLCADLWPEHAPALVALPDPKKGERLVLVTTRNGASRSEVLAFLKSKGGTELMVPSEILIVDALPMLGSGKTDYVELNRMVREKFGLASAA
jgi:acyl-[acyl-carrier-protein]-phospholipid O-acyltransferase / long-chain-fatty-acid--[acyl-carrier-protein] ligase